MFTRRRNLIPVADRGPLRVLFALTSMPVGGAETLLVNLLRRLDRDHFWPELVCLKELGPLGEEVAKEIPSHANLLTSKWDVGVLGRLTKLLRERRIDAIVTVGGGDKMFWGRLAAWRAGLPVILSALHSTGWPDGVTRMNRWLTSITDGFIAVAKPHGRFLIEKEKFPAEKVFVIPNGIDTDRFHPCPEDRAVVRHEIGLDPNAPVCGIVAALRPEKNHSLFLRAATLVSQKLPEAKFVIIGDGGERPRLEQEAAAAGIADQVKFLGTRGDIPRLLASLDLFALTSDNEASPVSILEAMSAGLPVVATNVGSVAEAVRPNETGFLTETGNAQQIADAWLKVLGDRDQAQRFGRKGRAYVVENGSLDTMVRDYQDLITRLYEAKCPTRRDCPPPASSDTIARRRG